MGIYRPAPYPRRPKNNNVFYELIYQLKMIYYRYELSTGQYVMSQGEKLAYNLIFLSIAVLLFSAVYYYLPRTLALSLHRITYYLTGSHKLQVAHVMQKGGSGAVASLAESQMTNASALTP